MRLKRGGNHTIMRFNPRWEIGFVVRGRSAARACGLTTALSPDLCQTLRMKGLSFRYTHTLVPNAHTVITSRLRPRPGGVWSRRGGCKCARNVCSVRTKQIVVLREEMQNSLICMYEWHILKTEERRLQRTEGRIYQT